MRSTLLPLIVFATASTALARLGDTRDQAAARYGLEKREGVERNRSPLLEGAKEITFEYGGWRIRSALLLATDGNQYVVREEYTKIWNAAVMKAGGTTLIRDFERDAVFQAESANGEWRQRLLADLQKDVLASVTAQYLQILGFSGKVWVRADGAVARIPYPSASIIFDLPQALKLESQLKADRQRMQREDARRILSPTALPEQIQTWVPLTPSQPLQSHSFPSNAAPQPAPANAIAPNLQKNAPPPPVLFSLLMTCFLLLGLGVALKFAIKSLRRLAPAQRTGRSQLHPHSTRPPSTPPSLPPPIPSSPEPRSCQDLTWDEFELLVGEIYRRQGFTVELSAGTGGDGGIDLILLRDAERVLVQCKNWKTWKVPAKDIREFFGVLVSDGASRGLFVTTGQYTRDARDFAVGKPIELLDGEGLKEMIREASMGPDDDLLNVGLWAPVFMGASRVITPQCPFCKTTMVMRTSQTGRFWGCGGFPKCRGQRKVRRYAESGALAAA